MILGGFFVQAHTLEKTPSTNKGFLFIFDLKMMAFSLMKIYIIKESFQEKLGELLVSLSYYPANNTLTLGVLKVTISKEIYKGDIKAD